MSTVTPSLRQVLWLYIVWASLPAQYLIALALVLEELAKYSKHEYMNLQGWNVRIDRSRRVVDDTLHYSGFFISMNNIWFIYAA